MGKAGKLRKRRRLENDMNTGKGCGDDSTEQVCGSDPLGGVSLDDISTTARTLSMLATHPELFKTRPFKMIRASLHELMSEKAIPPVGKTPTGRISDALRDGRWKDALVALAEMRNTGDIPKLGALQRWVRDCDAAGNDKNQSGLDAMRVLCAILRTSEPSLVGASHGCTDSPVHVSGDSSVGVTIKKYAPFAAVSLQPGTLGGSKDTGGITLKIDHDRWKNQFFVVDDIPAAERQPPNKYDLKIFASRPGSITLDALESRDPVVRVDVPYLPVACVLRNVFSPRECSDMVSACESMGMLPDEPTGASVSVLAHAFVWVVDEPMLGSIFERVRPHLPPTMGGGAVTGIQARWRCYRYRPGSVYRPHIDGAWPGSGVDENGRYVYDMYGDRMSRLTFLIYLNEGFEGGGTTYFTPAKEDEYGLDARPIAPRVGCVAIFPHGDTAGSLLHEGSAVTEGTKYVVRTDVLYMNA